MSIFVHIACSIFLLAPTSALSHVKANAAPPPADQGGGVGAVGGYETEPEPTPGHRSRNKKVWR